MQVHFTAAHTLCDIHIDSVTSTKTGQPVKYGSKTQIATDDYHVV